MEKSIGDNQLPMIFEFWRQGPLRERLDTGDTALVQGL